MAVPEPQDAPPLSPVELLRWAWRQLTSMRTALILLLLLALAAVPGSIVPQNSIDPLRVSQWRAAHPGLTALYDRLGLFSVYDSAWFSAIYILLVISLVGCIIPRLRVHWRALRTPPPKAPANLDRLPASARAEATIDRAATLDRAAEVLRASRYRVVVDQEGGWVAAEKGHLKEAGNLLFHLAVIVVLVGFAIGQLFGYKGGVIVLTGSGFSNSLSQYDEFSHGALFNAEAMQPLSFTVDDFKVSFITSGPQIGMPSEFQADLTYTAAPGDAPQSYPLQVNKPLSINGVNIFLIGHGYAPVVTVKDGDGNVAYQGPVVFLPENASFVSYGVIKVPDARPDQLAFEGEFYPTYAFTDATGPYSQFPDWLNPKMALLGYYGDLGMDNGLPQSVYTIDKTNLTKFQRPGSQPSDAKGTDLRIVLAPGEGMKLPDGKGSIEFNGVQRWVKLQVSHQPGKGIALAGVVLALLGLLGSLFIRSRRVWVRVGPEGDDEGRAATVVAVGGLSRVAGDDTLQQEIDRISGSIAGKENE
jgi:cytochrome c biogenesis protein